MAASENVQTVNQPNVNLESEDLPKVDSPEAKEKIAVLREKGKPVNILVIGPTGSGKSTLINNLLGKIVAEADHGASSVTGQVELHEGEYEGIKIRVYDTVGFGDTEGKSNQSIIKEIADAGEFDLVLVCVKMVSRADKDMKNMFTILRMKLNREMWKRSVIVLTFYNYFLGLGTVKKSGDIQKAVHDKITGLKTAVSEILSGHFDDESLSNLFVGYLGDSIISDIPYCVAGLELPPEETWLPVLWNVCVNRCSDNAQPLLKVLSKSYLIAIIGSNIIGSAAFGAGIGAVASGATATAGAVVGAGVGAALLPVAVGLVVVVGGVAIAVDWLTEFTCEF